jgi:hypothetical protein
LVARLCFRRRGAPPPARSFWGAWFFSLVTLESGLCVHMAYAGQLVRKKSY